MTRARDGCEDRATIRMCPRMPLILSKAAMISSKSPCTPSAAWSSRPSAAKTTFPAGNTRAVPSPRAPLKRRRTPAKPQSGVRMRSGTRSREFVKFSRHCSRNAVSASSDSGGRGICIALRSIPVFALYFATASLMNRSRGEGCDEGEPVDGVRWSSAMSGSPRAGRDGDDPSGFKFDLILPMGAPIGGGELTLNDAGSRCWDTPANESVERSAGAD